MFKSAKDDQRIAKVQRFSKVLAFTIQLVLPVLFGFILLGITLLVLSAIGPRQVYAASSVRPLAEFVTGTITVSHTASTTHQMVVYSDGRITDRFLADNDEQDNQIGSNISATTIAVMFEQHVSPAVDVGSQLEFSATTPITLNTASNIPGFSEDSYVVYTTKSTPSYKITQRTLAVKNDNCVIMELVIENTDSISLTNGKLLYMLDIQTGQAPKGDKGGFDLARRLVYQTDYNSDAKDGYAMGISLLEGDLSGYGILTDTHSDFPDLTLDEDIRAELNSPLFSPTQVTTVGVTPDNLVSWLVADIPNLDQGHTSALVFGLCARTITGTDETTAQAAAKTAMLDSFDQLVKISVSKSATPATNSPIIAGKPITYTITLSNDGCYYLNNVVVTDTIPTFTNLVTYSVSQGSITATNRVITADIGRLYSGESVTVTLVVTTSNSAPTGTLISNQAFISSKSIITTTNVVTHQVINKPDLIISKTSEHNDVEPGNTLTYTLTISNISGLTATNLIITDILPTETVFKSASDGGVETFTGSRVVTWTWSELAGGASLTRIVTVTVNNPFPAGPKIITNSATVAADETETLDNNTDFITHTVVATPILTISKDDYQDSVEPGDEFFYDIQVSNSGKQVVENVIVTDTLPIELDILFTSGCQQHTTRTVTFTIGQLDTQLSHCIIRVRVKDPLPAGVLTITNVATATASNADSVTGYDVDKVDAAPILKISKTNGLTDVYPDYLLTYTITVTNSGNIGAIGIITDILPDYTDFVTASEGGIENSGVVTWPLHLTGKGVKGYTTTLTVTVTVTDFLPVEVNILTNTAFAYAKHHKLDPVTDSYTNTIIAYPDLEINKTLPYTTVIPGQIITYTITITNNDGDRAAAGIVITDELPANTNFITASHNPITSGNIVTWTVTGPIGDDDIIQRTVTVEVNDPFPMGIPAITNTVGVTLTGQEQNIDNNFKVITTAVEAIPDLTITKTSSQTIVKLGDTITYTLTISNQGNTDAINVLVTDTLPSHTIYVNDSASHQGVHIAPNKITWVITSIAPYTFVTRTFQVVVDNSPLPAGVDTITNTALVGRVSKEINIDNNMAVYTNTIDAAPDLKIIKSRLATPFIVEPGSKLTYILMVSNNGQQTATGVVVTDKLPPYVTSPSANPPGFYDPDTHTVVWSLGNLPVGSLPPMSLEVDVINPISAGVETITNTAIISDDGLNGLDLNPGDNIAHSVVPVIATPNLIITKTDNEIQADIDQFLTYTLTITNTGYQDASGVVVTDTLPFQTEFMSASPVYSLIGNNVIWEISELDGNEGNQTLTVTVKVKQSSDLTMTNKAEVTDDGRGGPDPELENNVATDITTITPNPIITITKSNFTNTVKPDDELVYTIVISNIGTSPANNIVITDTLPDYTSFVDASHDGDETESDSGIVTWFIPSLPNDTQVERAVQVRVSNQIPPGIETITNEVEAVDSLDNRVTAMDIDTLIAAPDLSVEQYDGEEELRARTKYTYVLTVTNNGAQAATNVVLTDTLPTATGVILVSSPDGITTTPGIVTWDPFTLPAEATAIYTVTIATSETITDEVDAITNTAEVRDDGANGDAPSEDIDSDINIFVKPAGIYLPVIFRKLVFAPDLIVESISATNNSIQVVIKNIGNKPTTANKFWVDVYIDPNPQPPTRVNQIWNGLPSQGFTCDEGLVWKVTSSLAPNQKITLAIDDSYYQPGMSNFSKNLPIGTPVYAQVDSANPNTNYGYVRESHEITGGSYNNISGPTYSTVNVSGAKEESSTDNELLPTVIGNLLLER